MNNDNISFSKFMVKRTRARRKNDPKEDARRYAALEKAFAAGGGFKEAAQALGMPANTLYCFVRLRAKKEAEALNRKEEVKP